MFPDRAGRSLDAYPTSTSHGTLVGINTYGTAVYASSDAVSLCLLDERGELRSPPRTQCATHQFPVEDLGISVVEYVQYVRQTHGPWRALADATRSALAKRDVDERRLLRSEGVDEAVLETALERLERASGWTDRAAAAADLRPAVMDRPDATPDLVSTLLPHLDDVAGERDPVDAPFDSNADGAEAAAERNFERIATRRDLAYAVYRVTRSQPDQTLASLSRLLIVAGDRTYYDPETTYKEWLVDAIDAVGRARPGQCVTAVVDALETGDAPGRTLWSICHLERRYPSSDHPLLADEQLQTAVSTLADGEQSAATAAAEVEMLHEFDES